MPALLTTASTIIPVLWRELTWKVCQFNPWLHYFFRGFLMLKTKWGHFSGSAFSVVWAHCGSCDPGSNMETRDYMVPGAGTAMHPCSVLSLKTPFVQGVGCRSKIQESSPQLLAADENYPSREFCNNSLFSNLPCKALLISTAWTISSLEPNSPYCWLGISKGSINYHVWSQSWCLCSLSLPHSRHSLICPPTFPNWSSTSHSFVF